MPNGMRWVGLDVHAHASAVAVFDDVTGEVVTRQTTPTTHDARPAPAYSPLRLDNSTPI